jgi:excisionase family DNA binding protein
MTSPGDLMKEYLTMQEAARFLGIGRQTLWRLVRAGKLQTYQSEINRRVKLVKRSDIEDLMLPRPIESEEGKAAA